MARRTTEGAKLERVLRARDLFATSYGDVGSSIYYALALVAGLALGMTPVVFMIAAIFFVMTAATYAEATSMFPEAGGSSSFARHAFNEVWSVIAGWGQMLNYIITASISAFFVPHYLGVVWSPLRSSPGDVICGMAIIVILAGVNVLGVKESSRVNLVLAVIDYTTQVLLVAVGLVLVFSPAILVQNVDFGTFPTLKNFIVAIPVAMIAYTGIETSSNLAEEARDHHITVPRATKMTVFAVISIYAFLPSVALSAMPVHDGTTLLVTQYGGDPVLGIVKELNLGTLASAAEIYVGLLAATILVIATNAGMIGVSRLTYSMSLHRQLPAAVRKLHPRFKTPYIAIVAFAFVACLTILPGQADFLGKVYAFGAMLSFTIAHMSVIKLRWSRPDIERTYRGPGTVHLRGHEIPVFAVVGGIGTGAAWLTVFGRDPRVFLGGLIWVAIGLTLYALYRRSLGLSLRETAKVIPVRQAVEHEVEYESILVVFENGRFSAQAIETAAKMSARRRRAVHVIATIEVPWSTPVSVIPPVQAAQAAEAIERARVLGGRRVGGHVETVRPGEAGRRIIDTAELMRARAIVIALFRSESAPLFPRSVEKILAERPCRVILVTDSADDRQTFEDARARLNSAAAGPKLESRT
jgi:APA family basic amino acid/polyamine antiporter